jgi:hypothetical protein
LLITFVSGSGQRTAAGCDGEHHLSGTKYNASRLKTDFCLGSPNSKIWLESRMLKLAVLTAGLLCACTIEANARAHHRHHHGHRAHAWCGTYMSRYFGKSDRRLALAREWAKEGFNAGGPGVGVVVVWPHHVGIITGQAPDGEWIIHSGNDGGAVRLL